MYCAPNVRASLGDHVTRFACSAQKFVFWVEKSEKICETPYEEKVHYKKLHYKTAGRVDQLNSLVTEIN